MRSIATAAALAVLALAAPPAAAESARLEVRVSTPVALAASPGRVFVKVGLTGVRPAAARRRTPVNVAIVLDRSGSMTGPKLARAKEAALLAVGRLGPDDVVSVIAYDHTVQVLVPATRARDRADVRRRIARLHPGGSTALFAGVARGAGEVRKFLERERVNRVILLSDGLANVGPSSPGELAELGAALGEEGISVTTVGLGDGYNEDLMAALARASDGNHAFAREPADLARIFDAELGDVLSVVAREVEVEVRCAPGVRPIRVLGREASVRGGRVAARLSQLYAGQEKYLLLEAEVAPGAAGGARPLAEVEARWLDTLSRAAGSAHERAALRLTDSTAEVERHRDRTVMEASAELLASDAAREAIALRDRGRTEEARAVLRDNARFLADQAQRWRSQKLERLGTANREDLDNLDDGKWKVRRKVIRKREHQIETQQSW